MNRDSSCRRVGMLHVVETCGAHLADVCQRIVEIAGENDIVIRTDRPCKPAVRMRRAGALSSVYPDVDTWLVTGIVSERRRNRLVKEWLDATLQDSLGQLRLVPESVRVAHVMRVDASVRTLSERHEIYLATDGRKVPRLLSGEIGAPSEWSLEFTVRGAGRNASISDCLGNRYL